MKRKKKGYYALVMFAEFLKACPEPEAKKITPVTMSDITDGKTVTKTVLTQKWVFKFLPECFDVWYYDSMSKEPKFGPAESSDTITDVFEFFEIESVKDFEKLFCNTKNSENNTCTLISQSIERFVLESQKD
jgi:hypothetical protein